MLTILSLLHVVFASINIYQNVKERRFMPSPPPRNQTSAPAPPRPPRQSVAAAPIQFRTRSLAGFDIFIKEQYYATCSSMKIINGQN